MITSMIGSFSLDAVASSFMFILKHPSPAIFITVLSGFAVFAPIAAPSPYPMVPSPPDVRSVLGFLYL